MVLVPYLHRYLLVKPVGIRETIARQSDVFQQTIIELFEAGQRTAEDQAAAETGKHLVDATVEAYRISDCCHCVCSLLTATQSELIDICGRVKLLNLVRKSLLASASDCPRLTAPSVSSTERVLMKF
jgi:hypothetical protein